MADELHTPNHRWYEPRNHIPLAKEDHSKQWIFDSGIQKINAWIASQPWGSSVYSVAGFEPPLVADFRNDYYRIGGAVSTFDGVFTHDRDGNATMVDSDGLRKWGPHNLLLRSEEFDNASWLKSNATVTANAAVAPDGTTTADQVDFDGTSSAQVRQSITGLTVGAQYTLGMWVRADSATTVRLGFSSYTARSVTTEWQLISVSQNAGTTGHSPQIAENGETIPVYVWGAHVYRSDLGGMVDNPDRGDSYVPTTSSARYLARRGNHVYNGSAWVNEGLLNESEARTNLVTYSNDFTDASWAASNSSLALDAVGPDGLTSAYTMSNTATAASQINYQSVSVSSGNNVFSFFVKAGLVDFCNLRTSTFDAAGDGITSFDLSSGTVLSESANHTATIEPYGNGWYRVAVLFNTVVDVAGNVHIYMTADGGSVFDAELGSNGASSILIYGAQLEAGSTPSSYIPTNSGSTVTRAADTIQVDAGAAPWPTPNVIGEELATGAWGLPLGSGAVGLDADITFTAAPDPTELRLPIEPNSGSVYLLTVNITSRSSGSLRIFNGTTVLATLGSVGASEYVFVYGGSFLDFRTVGTTTLAAEVSVREIDPLSVSIQMDGTMDYADTGSSFEGQFYYWQTSALNRITNYLQTTGSYTGRVLFRQSYSGTNDDVASAPDTYSPGINVPLNIASRHGSTFINGAVDGTALTANTTPTALPDLSAAALQIGYEHMGNIGMLRVWADDLGDSGIATASAPSLEPSLFLDFIASGETSYTVSDWSE